MIPNIRTVIFRVTISLFVLSFVSQPLARGQESETTNQTEQVQDTILSMIEKSEWFGITFMIVLGIFSLIAAAVVFERLVNLTRGKVLPIEFVRDMKSLATKRVSDPGEFRKLVNRYMDAEQVAGKKQTGTPIAIVLRAGLLRAGRPVVEVEKAMEDALAREVSAIRGRVRPLSIVGNVAPLVGLLGTVIGMIMAFYTASQEGLSGKAESLAQGIYLALLTTAGGLTIAIPSMLFAAYFNGRIERYMREMDEQLMEVFPCFALMEKPNRNDSADSEEPVTAQLVSTAN